MQENCCTFLGHRDAFGKDIENKLNYYVEKLILEKGVTTFYLGNMGRFDYYAGNAVNKARCTHKEVELVWVIPYMYKSINNKEPWIYNYFDDVIFPPELIDLHYNGAIKKRNQWMIDNSAYLISYVHCDFGGAYEGLKYAKRQNICIINI